jgi:carotenoid cleavage dioxygenase
MASAVERKIRSFVTSAVGAIATLNRKRMPELATENPYLTGLNQPMSEEKTLGSLTVTGTIPRALDGRYLRIGPNPLIGPEAKSHHWFLGDGMAHGVRIKDGVALWYRNRWVRSADMSRTLGEMPAPGSDRSRAGSPNTNIVGIAGRTFAIVEAGGIPAELNDDLDMIEHHAFDDTLVGGFSAHPHFDPSTGERHAICYDSVASLNTVWHVVLDDQAHVIRREPIAVTDGPSIHDCAITKNYVLVFDLPVTFSIKALLAGHRFPYKWNSKHPARVGLCPRNGSGKETVWCDVDPCYVFHPANAYETPEGSVVVDVVAHETMFAHSALGPDSKRSRLERWQIDGANQQVVRNILHDCNQEFPRFNELYSCQPYRYIYSVALSLSAEDEILSQPGTQLFKYDLQTNSVQVHNFGAQRYPGEFVFVPSDESEAEDGGWLMGFVVDAKNQTTELVILNATDIGEESQASIHIPHCIPSGFHSNWI